MPKSEVYSWRVSPELKDRLMRVAQTRKLSLADLLDEISLAYLRTYEDPDDEARQRALQAALAPCLGTVEGDDPNRSRRAGAQVQRKLRDRRRSAPR